MNYDYIAVIGATATGKTNLAVKIASMVDGEIISCDSRQVYKGMDIGSGKDLDAYNTPKGKIPYHLIDILEPSQDYSVFHFLEDFHRCFFDIKSRGKVPVLCGGTYMYFTALFLRYGLVKVDDLEDKATKLLEIDHEKLIEELKELNPLLHNRTDLTEHFKTAKALVIARESQRYETEHGITYRPIELRPLVIATQVSREDFYKRIRLRLSERLREGLVDEVRALMNSGLTDERLDYFGLEYKFAGRYLRSELSKNDMIQRLVNAINEYAKKQLTGISKLERNGIEVNWIPPEEISTVKDLLEESGFPIVE
ncbi:MAG: tRNA (adenosine(37)-N6)-dimethylallyltransferase MiaA [Ignavibacteriaceae bacterium]|nr:tRNA (adenosine(37)-N6)-dimethylallyltransferase MiaA [Ignavibacteriaceae bacterium]